MADQPDTERKVIGYIVPSETYAMMLNNCLEQPAKQVYSLIQKLEQCQPMYEKVIEVPPTPPGDDGDTTPPTD